MINKDDWEIKKLSEFAIITMGQSPSSESYNDFEGLPFFQGNADFGKLHPKARVFCTKPSKLAEKNDVLISVRAPIGAVNISDVKCCIGRGLASVRSISNVSTYKYIYYSLISATEKLNRLGTGSTFKAISRDSLSKLNCKYYPLPIQQQIVSELDTLNEIITKKKQQLAELDNLAQATFYDMFGDPVRNEKGLPLRKLCKISSLKSGQFVKASDIYNQFSDGLYPCYGGNGLRGYTKSHTHSGELVLIGRQGALCGNVKIAKNMFHATEHAVVCTPIVKYEANWLYYMLEKINLHRYATGAAQPGLAVGVIEKIDIPIPPLELQTQFSDKINAIEKQKELIKKSITDTQLLFDYTMDKYFN